MLLPRQVLEGIRDGTIKLAFRRWRRPTVRSGGSLLTPVGELGILSVSQVAMAQISEAEARLAGYESLVALLAELRKRREGRVYRIEFGSLGPDPRIALRQSVIQTDSEHEEVLDRLRRMDARSTDGPWTLRTLELIESRPGVRAADLSTLLGQDKDRFKLNVRKLKKLGLTESLATGYRLSPRGISFLGAVRSGDSDSAT